MGLGVAEGVLLDAVDHRGLHSARADVVAVDAVGAELEGHALRHAGDGVLAGAVGAHAGCGGVAAVGGYDHDRALALRDHVLGGVFAGVDNAEDVYAVDLHVGLVGAVLDELVFALIAGVGDDHVDGAERGVCSVHKGLDLVLLGDVADEGRQLIGSDVEGGHKGVKLLLSGGGDGQLAALGCERAAEGLPDAAGRTGDEHYFVFQAVIHF